MYGSPAVGGGAQPGGGASKKEVGGENGCRERVENAGANGDNHGGRTSCGGGGCGCCGCGEGVGCCWW